VSDQVKNDWYVGLVDNGYLTAYCAWFAAHRAIGVTGTEPWQGWEQFARAAFWTWTFKDFALLIERPTVLTLDPQVRLHNETGPAMLWPDGWGFHAWHGTRVPADLIETGWDTSRILAEPNAEIRRCAIERLGWDQLITAAKLAQVGKTVDDPGNPGQSLTLYDVPEQIYDAPVRVLLCTNGTVERDGTRRRFGLTVPAEFADPIAAAAWTYDLTAEQYLTVARRA
jgi:hypothetical protein